jgi:hypothetical protein
VARDPLSVSELAIWHKLKPKVLMSHQMRLARRSLNSPRFWSTDHLSAFPIVITMMLVAVEVQE